MVISTIQFSQQQIIETMLQSLLELDGHLNDRAARSTWVGNKLQSLLELDGHLNASTPRRAFRRRMLQSLLELDGHLNGED